MKLSLNFYHSMGRFSRRQIGDCSLICSWKIGFDASCKLSPKETICMKRQSLFSGKIKKNNSKCLLKFWPSTLNVQRLCDWPSYDTPQSWLVWYRVHRFSSAFQNKKDWTQTGTMVCDDRLCSDTWIKSSAWSPNASRWDGQQRLIRLCGFTGWSESSLSCICNLVGD